MYRSLSDDFDIDACTCRPDTEAKAQIAWCKIVEAHCQVDIRIGTVGWSGRGSVMPLSRFDEPAGQYHSQ